MAPAPNRRNALFLGVTCLGISSVVVQIVSLREFLNVFAGNELVIGLILGNWLLLTGIGSYFGRFGVRLKKPLHLLTLCQAMIAVLPVAQVMGIRFLRSLHVPGMMFGIGEAFLFSFLFLLPYCLIAGFLLTLFTGISARDGDTRRIGEVYAADVTGDVLGGVLFSFVLVFVLDTVQTLIFLAILNMGAAFFMAARLGRGPSMGILTFILLAGLVFFFADLEKLSIRSMYPGQEVIYHGSTQYGGLTVTKRENQVSVFQNGMPAGSSRNIEEAEETVHYVLSQHPNPEKILMVSGGLSGALAEALKHSPMLVDYIEMDSAVLEIVRSMGLVEETPRVAMIAADARLFIRNKKNSYDAVILSLGDPATAQLNRFFTLEFFREVREALRPGGVFGFALSGAENYANPEIRFLASTVYQALRSVFPHIVIIPGDRQFLVAGERPLSLDIQGLLEKKGIETRFVNRAYLEGRLTEDRLAAARGMVSLSSDMNRDFSPAGYYGLIRFWLSRFGAGLLLPISLMAGIFSVIAFTLAASARKAVPAAMAASGFAGMGIEVALLIGFQICYGSVYHFMGILITAFLFGTAFGARWANVRQDAGAHLLRMDILLACVAFSTAPLLLFFRGGTPPFIHAAMAPFSFSLQSGAAGFLVGAQFPLAARYFRGEAGRTASILYSLDFLGASLGALGIAIFSIPLAGLVNTCIILGAVKLASSLGLWLRRDMLAEEAAPQKITVSVRSASLAFLLFIGIGLGAIFDATSATLYALSFMGPYHWALLILLAAGLAQAIGLFPARPDDAAQGFHNGDSGKSVARRLASSLRWLYFGAFSLVVFFPLFRCYFLVPYLFCHVCPRRCVFGYLRPYMVPAILIMNLERRHWCYNRCPFGTLFDQTGRVSAKTARLPRQWKVLSYLALALTVVSYFKVRRDFEKPATSSGSDWYTVLYTNTYSPDGAVIAAALVIILLAFRARRFFCEYLCPIGAFSSLALKGESMLGKKQSAEEENDSR